MARSSCVKCGEHRFEVVEQEPAHSSYKLLFVQCASRGGVAGVTEYFNVGALIDRLATALRVKL